MSAPLALLSLALGAAVPCPQEGPTVDLFGIAIDAAGDRDEDGVPDVWIGDPGGPADGLRTGRVWLVSGANGHALLEIRAPEHARDFGWSLVAIDDANGDGVRDVAVAARFVAAEKEARRRDSGVFLFSGSDGELLHTWLGPADPRWSPGSPFATAPALASVGAWDGFGDLAIGWPYASDETTEQGRVDVVSGRTGRVVASWTGEAEGDRFGTALTSVPDVDGDGKHDLAASTQPAPRHAPPAGREFRSERPAVVRVLGSRHEEVVRVASLVCSRFGSSLAVLPASGDAPPTLAVTQSCHERGIHLVSLPDGERLRKILPPERSWRAAVSFGECVLPVRDIDGDGVGDLVATAPSGFADVPAGVLSRERDEALETVFLADHHDAWQDGIPSRIGAAAASIGDVDGDGLDDFALGGADLLCGTDCVGAVVVVSGKDARPLRKFTRKGLGR